MTVCVNPSILTIFNFWRAIARVMRARFTAQDDHFYNNYHLTNYELKITIGYLIMTNNVFHKMAPSSRHGRVITLRA